jgi:hypothetical protein
MSSYESILKFKSLAIMDATDSEKQTGIFKDGVHLRYIQLDKSQFDKDSDFANFDYFISNVPNDTSNEVDREEIYFDAE